MTEYSIGVDLGGTNLRAAAIASDGAVVDKIDGNTQLSAGRDAVIGDIVGAIRILRDRLGDRRLAGVGIGVPGFIDIEKGIVIGSNNLAFLERHPVRDDIERLLGTPVILENDANAAALGEKWNGAGRDVQDLVLLTLGTGIGGGIISRGRVIHGYVGMAGELGHMTVHPNGNPCGCGNYGCLEKHASATAIVAMARLVQLGDSLTAKDVYDIAVSIDPATEDRARRARMCFRVMGESLGIAIANLVNVFNFPLILLSGGMLPAWDLFAPSMMEQVNLRSFTFRNTKTRIEKAILGNEAGLYGAAYLPFLQQRRVD